MIFRRCGHPKGAVPKDIEPGHVNEIDIEGVSQGGRKYCVIDGSKVWSDQIIQLVSGGDKGQILLGKFASHA